MYTWWNGSQQSSKFPPKTFAFGLYASPTHTHSSVNTMSSNICVCVYTHNTTGIPHPLSFTQPSRHEQSVIYKLWATSICGILYCTLSLGLVLWSVFIYYGKTLLTSGKIIDSPHIAKTVFHRIPRTVRWIRPGVSCVYHNERSRWSLISLMYSSPKQVILYGLQ